MVRSEVKISAGDPISYAELKRKAKAGDLSDAEIERYFEVDEKARARFRFLMKLKPGAVKITGQRPTSDEVNDLDTSGKWLNTSKAEIAGDSAPFRTIG